MIAIVADRVFDGQTSLGPCVVLVDAGSITDLLAHAPAGADVHRLPAGAVLAPGFVDLQVNGGGGVLFNDAPSAQGLQRITAAHARLGTTSLLATLISSDRATLRQALAAVRNAVSDGLPGLRGIHVEGPFIAPARRGIHDARALRPMTDEDAAELAAAATLPLLVTLAPEIVPPDRVRALADAGIAVFVGHTDAPYAAVMAAFAAGARGATHLFNAMSQLASRAPGAVGAALDSANAYAGIIADGHHVHAASIRLAHRALGHRLMLVSDAMPTVGSDSAGFVLDGRRIALTQGRLTDAHGTLAGAHLSMGEAVRHLVAEVGIDLDDALRMATATPAECMGLAGRGRIAPGAHADLVALDAALGVVEVWQGGVRRV